MKSDLSIKELQKGYDAFNKLHDEATSKLTLLEKNLLEEVRVKGCTDYSKNLSSSIKLETQHKNNAKKEMEEYQQEIWKKQQAERIEDEYSSHIGYHINNNYVKFRERVSYLAPKKIAINKFIKIVQDNSVCGYESANGVRTHMMNGGSDKSAQHLREHPGCVVIVVEGSNKKENDKVIKTIDIKTGVVKYLVPEKDWFKK